MGSLMIKCFLILTGFFISNPPEDIVSQRVDLIEINHFFDEEGLPKSDQIIFYEWSEERARFDVVDYRRKTSAKQNPCFIDSQKGYLVIWHDTGKPKVLRQIHARNVIESWTQFDPEMVERRKLPKDKRSELLRLANFKKAKRVRR